MGMVDKQKLTNELRRFNQRKLLPGEVVLLSYVIANSLPILERDVQNPNLEMVKHNRLIESILYRLCEYASLEKDTLDIVKQHVLRFLLWRSAIAWGTQPILFTGNHDTVIDELSSLLRFHDTGVLCSVGDVAVSANWLVSTFIHLLEHEVLHLASVDKE